MSGTRLPRPGRDRRPARRARRGLARRLVALRARRRRGARRRARVRDDGAAAAPARAGGLRRHGARAPRGGEGRRRLDARRLPHAASSSRSRSTPSSKTRAPSTAAVGVDGARRGVDRLRARRICSCCASMHDEPRLLAFTVLLTVFAADTFAYFGGRLIGRHKLAPTLSPGKTWEGFVVGSLAGVFVSFVALYDDRDHYLDDLAGDRARARRRPRGGGRRPLRVDAQARHAGEGHRAAARRPRRRPRPDRRAALRRRRPRSTSFWAFDYA